MHPQADNVIGSSPRGKTLDRYLQAYRDVCGWHEKVGFDEMVDHRLLTPDRMVQETRFSSGWNVVVNFGESPWNDERGFSIPPRSFHTFEAHSDHHPEHTVFSESPNLAGPADNSLP
jgi:hypothetical protein